MRTVWCRRGYSLIIILKAQEVTDYNKEKASQTSKKEVDLPKQIEIPIKTAGSPMTYTETHPACDEVK